MLVLVPCGEYRENISAETEVQSTSLASLQEHLRSNFDSRLGHSEGLGCRAVGTGNSLQTCLPKTFRRDICRPMFCNDRKARSTRSATCTHQSLDHVLSYLSSHPVSYSPSCCMSVAPSRSFAVCTRAHPSLRSLSQPSDVSAHILPNSLFDRPGPTSLEGPV